MPEKGRRRVLIIGLDCAEPSLVFDRWKEDLTNLARLSKKGTWGNLRSCVPAITVPAWTSMLSSLDPGALGVYGFRNRSDYSYYRMFSADGEAVRHDRVWDLLGAEGKQSVIIGVPQTYPVRPISGLLVSGFLTPNVDSEFTFPGSIREDVLRLTPGYGFDVIPFRTEDKPWLLESVHRMTESRCDLVDHFLQNAEWDFFMVMEIGLDRLHHGFWSFHDPAHKRYEPGNPYEGVLLEYYQYLDDRIGGWLEMIDEDVSVLVVSDHGGQPVDGWICINEWLWREGYLRFLEEPEEGLMLPFEKMEVDWGKTRAWGAGGYYGRVFFNVEGREPEGAVRQADYKDLQDELVEKLSAIPTPEGSPLRTEVFKPQEIYSQVSGIPPDLLVYFDDLRWRSSGSLGHGGIYSFENDTGPDECNHAQDGLVIFYDSASPGEGRRIEGAQLMDVAPTVLELMGVPIPDYMQGNSLVRRTDAS